MPEHKQLKPCPNCNCDMHVKSVYQVTHYLGFCTCEYCGKGVMVQAKTKKEARQLAADKWEESQT